MTAYLQFQEVSKRYGQVTALDGISFQLEPGATLALLGPNGAGKSTLFGCLLGFTHPASGEITWRGKPVTSAVRSRFGYTAERIALYWPQTVWENGAFFARLRGYSNRDMEEQLVRVGLDQVMDRKVRQLSKGMLQRLGLAIALCGRPELLVLDEPFNGLDPVLLDELTGILREEQERGATLLISTHTISAVEPLSSHVAVLRNGQLGAFATLATLRDQHGPTTPLETIYRVIARGHERAPREEVLVA